MDLIHKMLNIVMPPMILLMLLFFFPFYLLFKFLSFIKRYIYSENVAGKVVLVTGASSGIGEHLTYEYGRRGACLALVARREDRLRAVADKAQKLGSPNVIVIPADVSKVEDCKRFVDQAFNHFQRLDHLVINAGVALPCMFEDSTQIGDLDPIMKTNFWGSVYSTRFAVSHLKKSKGKIIVIASIAGWLSVPRMSIYSASKAALIRLYETLRIEFGSDIGITIVTPGVIESEITTAEFISKIRLGLVPSQSAERCGRAIVNSACRGERYLTEPSWVKSLLLVDMLCPQLLEWTSRFLFIDKPTSSNKNE